MASEPDRVFRQSLVRGPGPRTALFLLIALGWSQGGSVSAANEGVLPLSGQFELRAESLRMQRVRLQMPEGTLVDFTGKDEPDSSDWQVSMRQEPGDADLWRLRLEQTTDVVRRRVDYVISLEQNDVTEGAFIPVIATESAMDVKSKTLLYRSQTIEWTAEDALREETRGIDLERTSMWVLNHLQQVYSREILDVCTDYFGHHPDPSGSPHGFASSVACIKRRIEIDPQDIEAYTLSAWLLWSDWVTWKLYPKRIPDGQGKVEEAIRLIKIGRAANPANAAYHLDAAQTLEPLARHHRPELMAFVIRYYLYAENLATETALQIRVRLSLGHRYRQQGKTDDAIRWYQKVLEIDPENRVAQRYLDKLGAKRGPDIEPDGRVI